MLELGCGTGRLTRRMLELGAAVTAVDNSTEMLEEVPTAATKVCADIESLRLDEQFSVVVLASCLINHPLKTMRESFVRVARRHLVSGGMALIERHDPEWLAHVEAGPQGSLGGVTLSVESIRHTGHNAEISLCYTTDQDVWRQSFEVVVLHKPEIEAMLSQERFGLHRWLGARERWVSSVAV